MTKPKEKNKITKLTITLGSRELYFTLDEAKTLQKMLNETLIQQPTITWGYYNPSIYYPGSNYITYPVGNNTPWISGSGDNNLSGNCTTTTLKSSDGVNTI